MVKSISVFLLVTGILVGICPGRVITVDDGGPADFSTIQAAIDDAVDGDVVEIQPGTYTGEGNRDIDFKGKAITVRSVDPNDPDVVDATVVDCQGSEEEPHRGFIFQSGEGLESILSGITITRAYCYSIYGGAVLCVNASSPFISNCTFRKNTAERGGAIYCGNVSSPMVTNCYFIENTAGLGGAIGNEFSSAPTIIDCMFVQNTAGGGGAILNGSFTKPLLENCRFIGNMAATDGGAIYNSGSQPRLVNCIISYNVVTSERHDLMIGGGGIFNGRGGCPVLENCVLEHNSAANLYGGGILYNGIGSSIVLISNCVIRENCAKEGAGLAVFSAIGGNSIAIVDSKIYGNRAMTKGGGMFNGRSGAVGLTNCLIYGNVAGDGGGGIYSEGADTELIQCVVAGNLSTSTLFCGYKQFASPSTFTASNSIFCNPSGNEIFNEDDSTIMITYSNIRGGYDGLGNIDSSPLFVMDGHWDPNDTPEDPNDDFWVDGDYHLKSQGWRWDTTRSTWTWDETTSPCIDAGNPASPLAEEPLTVPTDPDNDFGENLRINMGAYGGTAQASMAPPDWSLLADLTNDGAVDFADYAHQAKDWQTTGAKLPGDLNRNELLDFPDIALLADNWLRKTTWH